MAKTTILRVEKGTVLTAEMRKNLKSLLGDFETREYIKTPDLKKIYQRRIDILAEAFEFIYNSITPSSCTSAELAAYLQFCKQLNQLPDIADQDKYQEILTNFTGMLVNALIDNWNWPYRVRDAVGLLNKAEQYVIMQKGRQNLATLSTVSQLKDSFVLNWENTLPSCSKQTIDELIKIKQTYLSDLPNWLEQLPYYQQVFFLTSPETCTTVTQLNSENNDIIDLWRSKTLSNDDYIAIIDGYSIDGTKKKKPDWYRELPGNRKQILRSLLISEGNNKEKVEQKLNDLTKKLCEKSDEATAALIKKIRGLPSWFVKLPLSEQKLLKAALDKSENVADVVHFLPSRLRTIPGLANLAEHNCAILDTNCNVKKQFGPKLRSSHLASRDVKSQPEPIGQLHARRNYAQILEIAKTRYEKYSILIQTLISPVPGAEVVDVPDEYLDRMREWVIQNNSSHGFTVYTKNHPYNVAKRFIWTGASDPDCLALLAAAKAVTPKKPALEKLIRSYEATLNSGFLTTNLRDYTGRELSLSSYEHLLVEHIGGVSYGSCVSGKDRKALEIIHSDAMQIYYEIYNEWPQFNEFNKDKRGNFVDIVSDLYVTRHAHEFADENAPGTEGIKTPENYYPADIAAAIQKKWIRLKILWPVMIRMPPIMK